MIETGRLRLEPLGLRHLEGFLTLNEDPEVTRFVPRLDPGQAAERLRLSEQEWQERGHGLMAVLLREDGRFIGRSGLKYWPEFDEVEVGWALMRDTWGHGYATEAGDASLRWGFAHLDVPYLTAMIQPLNVASVRVAERLGMTRRRTRLFERFGVVVDVYARSREDVTRAG